MTPRPLTPRQVSIVEAVRALQPATKGQIAGHLGGCCMNQLGEQLFELRRTERIGTVERGRYARWVIVDRSPARDATDEATKRCRSVWDYAARMVTNA